MPRPLSPDNLVALLAARTSTGVWQASPGVFFGLIPLVSSSMIVTLHDNATEASGDVLFTGPLTAGLPVTFGGKGIPFRFGLYMTLVSGTGTVRAMVL